MRLVSLLLALSLHFGTPAPDQPRDTIRLWEVTERDGTHFTVTTLHLDPDSVTVIQGRECYTRWREDIVRTAPKAKYVNVTYREQGRIHRLGAPAYYRFEFDNSPAMTQELYWEGECVRNMRWSTATENFVPELEADTDDMYRILRELGVEL